MATAKGPYFDLLMGTIDTFNRCKSSGLLSESISAFSKRLGYEYAAHIAGPSANSIFKQRLLLSTWPRGWVDQYSQPGWNKRDRVAHALRVKKNAFLWSSVEINKDDIYANRVMVTAARDFGMRCGICVPIHGHGGYQSGFSFSGYEADQSADALGLMQLVGVYAVNKFASFGGQIKIAGALSSRERDVMTWIALGKTAWDIGEILNIAEDTVNKIAKTAMAKLDAHTRAQAAVEAFRRGEINP
ncbi:MAG: autoinducer binding domain-containing protein [Afipia sp.]|nr:autoinducer binding domain-containing protein [Afipia sp.]